MSFEDWVKNSWLDPHQSSREEIGNLLGIVERDLKRQPVQRCFKRLAFAIAYNAALQAATAALACRRDTAHPETVITIGSSSLFHLRSARAQHSSEASTHFEKSGTSATMDIGGGVADRELQENDGDCGISSPRGRELDSCETCVVGVGGPAIFCSAIESCRNERRTTIQDRIPLQMPPDGSTELAREILDSVGSYGRVEPPPAWPQRNSSSYRDRQRATSSGK